MSKLKCLLVLAIFPITVVIQSQWILQLDTTGRPIVKIQFINQNTGWTSSVGGQTFISLGNLFKTTNSGLNWVILQDGFYAFPDFQFIDQNTGWLISRFISTDNPASISYILKTTNGGFYWQDTFTVNGIASLSFINHNVGWSVGAYGKIYENGGVNWMQLRDSADNSFNNEIYFQDSNTGFFTTLQNIFKTTDGGLNWYIVFNDSYGYEFDNIQFVNTQTGWIAASKTIYSYIFKTTNGGENWYNSIIDSNNTYYINNILFMTSENNGYLSISPNLQSMVNNKIYKTTNGGINWFILSYVYHNPIISMYFVNNNIGWIGGGQSINTYGRATIFKTTNGGQIGIIPISNTIPERFTLSQNYPNPFNPLTQIKFDIPKSSFINLTIYDAMGREISVLVNENLQAGSYSVDWDASAYPSGVYFYKIIAGEYIQTRKMVLVK
jgi:photosystem II stability/assembly factor-like uncharacterized protein